MEHALGPTLAQLAGIELVTEPPFDPSRVTPGSLDRRILGQTNVWVDARAQVHALTDMSDAYRANVVAHLHVHASWMWSASAVEELLTKPVSVNFAQRDAGIPFIGETDSHAWLEATPLVRELRALTPTIAPPHVLVAWARDLRTRSARAGTDIWKVPGAVVPMPQDPDRNWAQDVRQAPPYQESDDPDPTTRP